MTLELMFMRATLLVLAALGTGAVTVDVVLRRGEELRSSLTRYVKDVEQHVAFLRWKVSGTQLVTLQGVACAVAMLLGVVGHYLVAALMLVPVVVMPSLLEARRARRVAQMEEQLEGWLAALASSLRATPSLGEAIEFSLRLVASPLRDELEMLVKEQKLGETLESALKRVSERVGSRVLSSALATLNIGQRTGGDVSQALEKSAGTFREMARLEGVVRVKTAEGKAQGYMMAALPAPLVALLHGVDPQFLRPLVQSSTGHLVIAAAGVAWLIALVAIRRIVRVDI